MRAVLLVLLFAGVATADEPPVVAAARQRQKALQSVEMVLKVKSPSETGTGRLVFDGPKVLVEYRFIGEKARTSIAATDGERVKSYLLLDTPTHGESAGNINPPSTGVSTGLPLAFAVRPLDPVQRPLDLGKLTPAGTADVNGRTCEEFRGTFRRLPMTAWFDPVAGYSLRRMKYDGGVVDVESSDANPAGVWLPTKYTVKETDGAGRVEVSEYTVERVEVGKQYPASEFDPPWPAGLRIYDLVKSEVFVSGADGVSQPADNRTPWQRAVSLWWVPIVVVGLTVGLIGWRMWRRRKASG